MHAKRNVPSGIGFRKEKYISITGAQAEASQRMIIHNDFQ